MQNSKNKLKKIAIIGIAGIPANYGGFETLVDYITKDLNQNFNITVYCSTKSYPNKLITYNDCKLHYINLKANGIQSILYDIRSIFHAIKYADILLILGVSGCVILPLIKLFSKKKIIVNIDGLEWKRQKWNGFAKRFLKLSERFAVKVSDAVIGDNKFIQDYIGQKYGKKAHLIAYGGDHCSNKTLSQKTLKKYPFLNAQYAFKVCRIEPENNIEMILEAFTQIDKIHLVLIGNWSNSYFGNKIRSLYGSFENIYLLNPIYDNNILDQIRSNCKIYIHGHSAGGTNPSLVEAMYMKLPVFCFDVVFNKITTKGKAKYFKTSEELKHLLTSVNDRELKQVANDLFEISKKEYKWSLISKKYQEILNNI
tara:strand:+ start:331 stop:1434 length:1104 start_codon:yes stop_codon:yes gene_type:complete